MKKYQIATIALAAALVLPGMAQAYPKQGWYVGIGGGVGFQQDSDATVAGVTDKIEFDPGFVVSGAVGYGFENQLRPELEISYRRNNVDQVSGPFSGAKSGNFNAIGFLGNLFYDFDTRTGLTPYLGVGAGGAFVGADNAGTVASTSLDTQELTFAYQGIAGLAYELSERWDVTADYRYFRTLEPEFKTRVGAVASQDVLYGNHSFLMGLRYVFGVPRPLPEPVSMRAAPRPVTVVPAAPPMMQPLAPRPMVQVPPPAPVPAVPETYIVFFDFDKYYLTSEAKETIERAADAFKRGGSARVEVSGHTDTRGKATYNQRLSQRRAKVVREYLAAQGVPSGDIITRAAGERELMVPTANNVREAKNRRAEIVLK